MYVSILGLRYVAYLHLYETKSNLFYKYEDTKNGVITFVLGQQARYFPHQIVARCSFDKIELHFWQFLDAIKTYLIQIIAT